MKSRYGYRFSLDSAVLVRVSKRLWREDDGQDLAEYGLLVVLIGLSAVASMQSLASAISSFFNSTATSLTTTS
jgi:Flp pilus assembly pilin Flp